jgi:hypothetical protein
VPVRSQGYSVDMSWMGVRSVLVLCWDQVADAGQRVIQQRFAHVEGRVLAHRVRVPVGPVEVASDGQLRAVGRA